jgi:hypothetical protein
VSGGGERSNPNELYISLDQITEFADVVRAQLPFPQQPAHLLNDSEQQPLGSECNPGRHLKAVTCPSRIVVIMDPVFSTFGGAVSNGGRGRVSMSPESHQP